MTANAINTAVPNPAALAGSTAAGGVSAAGGGLAGFEALLAALFPQGAPNAQAVATATTGGKAVVAAAVDPIAEGDGEARAEGQGEVAVETADAATTDSNTALAASLAGAQLTIAENAAPKAPTSITEGLPTPRTPVAAKRLYNERVLQGPALTDKGEPANEAAPEGEISDTTLATPTLGPSKPAPETARSAPPAWGRDKVPGTPAAPALANAAAHAAPDAVDQPAPPAPPEAPVAAAPTAPAAVETAQPAVATAAVARPEPQAPAQKPGKAERGKSAERDVAAAADLKAPQAADKPATANPVNAAPRPAAAQADAAAPEADAASAAPESPDATFSAETQTATPSSTAPAQASAHAVRGSPETVANLAAQIIRKLEGQSTRFDVELDPAGLGKVNVRVEIGAHGAITAAMTFDNPQAAQELRSRAAELQRALEQAGFNLSSALSFDVAQDRGQHQHGQAWQDQNETGRAFRGQAFRAALDTAGDAAQAAQNGALRLRRGVSAGLDVRI